MIHCSNCEHLVIADPDGLLVACSLLKRRYFIDDLPLTVMDGCPLLDAEGKVDADES